MSSVIDTRKTVQLASRLSGNKLVDGLPSRQRSQFLAQCETVPISFGERLAHKDLPIRHVFLPLTGFVSLIIILDGHRPLELNIIGREGMLGSEIILGARIATYTSVVQGSGTALRLSTSAFQKQLESSPALHRIGLRYVNILAEQQAQSIACNCFHEVSQRLARWLLMTHDRADGNDLELTHAFLAAMLGVRRSAVTIAAGHLQEQNLISYSRGRIHVLSRSGLEETSCECYCASVKAYETGFPADSGQGTSE